MFVSELEMEMFSVVCKHNVNKTLELFINHWHTSSYSAAKALLDRGIFHLNVLFYTNH